MIARLHDADGRIAVPGLYDRVRDRSAAERRQMATDGPTNSAILRDGGSRLLVGERRFSVYERTTIRPALTINGITGGYQGLGGKGIIQREHRPKISLRCGFCINIQKRSSNCSGDRLRP